MNKSTKNTNELYVVSFILPAFFIQATPNYNRAGMRGFSIYKDVLICWDEDRDTRVVNVIDQILENDCNFEDNLIAISETEGTVTFLWKDYEPAGYENGEDIKVLADCWSIMDSQILNQKLS